MVQYSAIDTPMASIVIVNPNSVDESINVTNINTFISAWIVTGAIYEDGGCDNG